MPGLNKRNVGPLSSYLMMENSTLTREMDRVRKVNSILMRELSAARNNLTIAQTAGRRIQERLTVMTNNHNGMCEYALWLEQKIMTPFDTVLDKMAIRALYEGTVERVTVEKMSTGETQTTTDLVEWNEVINLARNDEDMEGYFVGEE